jgi:hypothetical protein
MSTRDFQYNNNGSLAKAKEVWYNDNGTMRRVTDAWFNDGTGVLKQILPLQYETPPQPVLSYSGYGCIKLTSSATAYIMYNGESKISGSTWYYNGTEILDSNAYAFIPSDSYGSRSANSTTLNVKILGRVGVVRSDGDETYQVTNYNNITVGVYTKSSSFAFVHDTYVSVGGSSFKAYQDNSIAANSIGSAGRGSSGDGFDNDENRTGRYMNKTTYSWFQKTGYVSSALVQCRFEHKNYGIEGYKYDLVGLK